MAPVTPFEEKDARMASSPAISGFRPLDDGRTGDDDDDEETADEAEFVVEEPAAGEEMEEGGTGKGACNQ